MVTADYQELLQGKSVKEKHQVGIQMDNAVLVPDTSLQAMYGSDKLWTTYHFFVFRAGSDRATLAVSDWVSDERIPWPGELGPQVKMEKWKTGGKPGGPIGQELMHNFIEIQPYLEN